MIRVFLDANVLFSAAWRDGNGLLCLWQHEQLHLVSSPYATLEAERNLSRKRPERLAQLQALLAGVEVSHAQTVLDDGHDLPAKDQPILAAAVAAHCMVLLTGDVADFGHLIGASQQGVRVRTARMLLVELASLTC